MQTINSLFDDGELYTFLTENQQNNWKGTRFEKYVGLSTKNKGVFGEALVERFMKTFLGATVSAPTSPGHDRIFDSFKTEIKFSLANSPRNKKIGQKLINPDEFTFNHIAIKKDWDRFIFFGVNPNKSQFRVNWRTGCDAPPEYRAYFMNKSDFVKYMDSSQRLFSPQQGGIKGGNDDYMVAGYKKFQNLIQLPFVHDIKKW
jgi:hypothetical protein